jgi:hypothetical protein
MPETRLSTRPAGLAITAAAVLSGLVVRLAFLDASLWLDEFSTLWAVESSFREVLHRVPAVMGQSPLYYLLPWASVHLFGESEVALRLPSLLAVAAAAFGVGLTGSAFGGRKAFVWAGLLFWLCYPAIWASVDARPYGLAMCFGALAALGFVRACTTGRLRDRGLWIVGGAGLIWTHYIFAPFIAGFGVAYVWWPIVRGKYLPRQFSLDAAAMALLLLTTLNQLTGMMATPEDQAWMFTAKHLGVTMQFVPFAAACLMPVGGGHQTAVRTAMRGALWLALAAQVGTLEVAHLAGVDVVSARYASVAIVAAAILAGDTLARLKSADLIAPVAIFALGTMVALFATYQICGSLSGAGYQQWREAVATLRPALSGAPDAPVLYRSGNAEDDLSMPGELGWPATLAPLRSPGERAPDWNIVPLTYRWFLPGRASYFDEVVAPRLEHARVFFLLCLASDEPGAGGYCPNVEAWIHEKWPAGIRVQRLGPFRQLSVIRFDRTTLLP